MEKCICVSVSELKQLEVVIKVIEKQLEQSEVADILNIRPLSNVHLLIKTAIFRNFTIYFFDHIFKYALKI
jgi:hypothetical protein